MRIELVAPDAIFAGTEVSLEIVLVCDRITRIASADAELVATHGFHHGGIDAAWRSPPQRARLIGDQLLAAGSATRCRFAASLPAEQPPSHEIRPAYAFVELTVVVAIAGGRELRTPFRIPIRAATPRVVTRKPASLRTRPARPADPRFELSLAATRLAAGETMVGSVAVFHVDDREPQRVELVLEPVLVLTGAVVPDAVARHVFEIAMPAGSAGTTVPFQLAVPASVTPSFFAKNHALHWTLVARTGRLALEAPIVILDASAGATTAALTAAPGLADARVAAVFEAFAVHHGWRADGAAIARSDAGIELRLAYDYRGKVGTFLVARCGHPAFGVELAAGPRRLFASGISLGIPGWDERYQVRARSAEQVVGPLRAVAPSLLSSGVLGEVARWTDDELVLEREVVAIDTADLLAATDALMRIAANLRRARELVAPPVDVDVAAWRSLARGWGGELRPGDLGIVGTLDRAPVRLALRFDDRGHPVALAASIGPTPLASREVAFELPDGELVEVRVADGVASGAWRWTDRLDVAHARTLVETLRAHVARLEPAASPYR